MKINQGLLALVNKVKAEGLVATVSETPVDEYIKLENSTRVWQHTVPWNSGKMVYRQERSLIKPCFVTALVYGISVFKSQAAGHFGELTEGVSVDLMGYDCLVDGQGKPILIDSEIEGQEPTLALITEDEDGQPLAPKFLMSFRPETGTDFSKPIWQRPKGVDMLNMAARGGVPRKKTEKKEGEKTNFYADIQWELLPNLEDALKNPIINAAEEENEAMLEFIKHIPIQANAPSKRASLGTTLADTEVVANPVLQASEELEENPFDTEPKAMTSEATSEEVKEVKSKKTK